MFFEEDESEPGHPIVTALGVTLGLIVYLGLYLLYFFMVFGFVAIVVLPTMLVFNLFVSFDALASPQAFMLLILAGMVGGTVWILERKVEDMALHRNVGNAMRRVRHSIMVHRDKLRGAEQEAERAFAGAEGASLMDAAQASPRARRMAWLHRVHMGLAVLAPPGLAAWLWYWALGIGGYAFDDVMVLSMFLVLPWLAVWFLWMGAASAAGMDATLEARKADVGVRVARERAEAQAGAISVSLEAGVGGEVTLASPSEEGLTLVEEAQERA